jgi:hypothetical protein
VPYFTISPDARLVAVSVAVREAEPNRIASIEGMAFNE